ncbi:hypothetical protein ACFLXA_02780 [Chloroflexota bacterium]
MLKEIENVLLTDDEITTLYTDRSIHLQDMNRAIADAATVKAAWQAYDFIKQERDRFTEVSPRWSILNVLLVKYKKALEAEGIRRE